MQIFDSLPDAGLTGVDWLLEDQPPVCDLTADQPDGTTQVHFNTPSVPTQYVFSRVKRSDRQDTSEGGGLYLSAVVVDHSCGLLSVKDAGSMYLFSAGVSYFSSCEHELCSTENNVTLLQSSLQMQITFKIQTKICV